MERRSERKRKNEQRQAGNEQGQSWIWERAGELASEGDTVCSVMVLSPGKTQQSCHSSLKTQTVFKEAAELIMKLLIRQKQPKDIYCLRGQCRNLQPFFSVRFLWPTGRQHSYFSVTFKDTYKLKALPIVKTAYKYKVTHKQPVKFLLES